MHKRGTILAGLIVFLGLITYPFWSNMGRSESFVEPELPSNVDHCVRETSFMRTSHMKLLHQWRDEVVRHDDYVYESPVDGTKYVKSLTNTCMSCHKTEERFCDRCHKTAGVDNYCWDCHNKVAPAGASPYYDEMKPLENGPGDEGKARTLLDRAKDAAGEVMHP